MSVRFLLAVGVVIVTACGGGAGTSSPIQVASKSPGGSPTAIESPQGVESATAAASSGDRTCVSSSQGEEVLCSLEAGTYSTEFLRPRLTYTVPSAGWGSLNREASPGNFHLFPPGASLSGFNDGTSDDITLVSAVVAPGTCNAKPSTEFDQTFDGLVEFLTKDDHITVSKPHDVKVGGWDGTAMDIKFVKGDGCSDGVYADLIVGVDPSHGAFGVTPSMGGTRLYLLHNPTAPTTLAIAIDDAAGGGSEYGDGEAWYTVAQSVLDTFVFSEAVS